MPQTFGQYLINNILPPDIRVDKPVDSNELKRLLIDVNSKHPEQYGDVVMKLKGLGDKFSTLEGITMGVKEIDVPNRAKRDSIIRKYKSLYDRAKSDDEKIKYQDELQKALIENDTLNTTDDASMMVRSGAMGGSKKIQLMKLRTTPVLVQDQNGDIFPEIFTKGYSEGQPILHTWLQAAESRRNLAIGRVEISSPGELNKVIGNIMNESVVSMDDCGTKQGVMLFTRDDDVLDRYLAAPVGKYLRNTLITPEIHQQLIKSGPEKILVRSPQTCAAKDNTLCSKCFGLSISTGKPYNIGDNAGLISSGALAEPLTQLTLSAKHSVTLAEKETGLLGEKGFRTYTTMPKEYPHRKILCELYGVVYRIRRAPQGGFYIQIRVTRPVPDRYIEKASKVENMKGYMQYYIPPQRKILENIEEGSEVYPGMELTDGIDHLKDVARLRNLGYARSVAAEGMRNIYKNTGQKIDRRHFELLSRNMMNHVRLEKVPAGFPYKRGEIVEYNALVKAASKIKSETVSLDKAIGATLAEQVNQFTVGTEVTKSIAEQMKKDGIKKISVTHDLEVSAYVVPMVRALNVRSRQWLGKLNHRYIKDTLKDAATQGQSATIHGFNPIASYAYGLEMGQDEQGRY